MGGKKYSAFVTLAVEAEDGRINNTAFTLKLDGIDTPLSTSQAQGVYTFPKTQVVGYTVSGNVSSFGSDTDQVTIQLIEEGQPEVFYETTVTGGTLEGNKYTASFTIEEVLSGTYTMKVMKPGHAPWTETITVGASAITDHTVKLYMWGDVNGDGSVNATDAQEIQRKAAYLSSCFDSDPDVNYCILRADVNGDGSVNATDAQEIQRKAAYLSSVIPGLP